MPNYMLQKKSSNVHATMNIGFRYILEVHAHFKRINAFTTPKKAKDTRR
uniref:Uncharacterized protein n=1 Tax=Arundo donax TaxID=35708 RepID=A0A0A9BRK4_ARUDO